jgi:hypothetical protein
MNKFNLFCSLHDPDKERWLGIAWLMSVILKMIMLRCILFNFCLLTVGIKTEFGASCFELIGNELYREEKFRIINHC